MGKESKKERLYVYIQLIDFAVQQKLIQHGKSTPIYSNKYSPIKIRKNKNKLKTYFSRTL